jgi:hypothetical protein
VRATVEAQLATAIDARLVTELLDAHEEAKRNYYLGGDRLAEVEGGRFCEAAFRILEFVTTGASTPLGRTLDTQGVARRLENLPANTTNDALRLHIPRALRVVYDIRNNRDAAHLADGIDPNLQDSTLVISVIDWVLAEFIRLYHNIPANDAQRVVEDIVSRRAPVVQEFGDFLKVLRNDLGVTDFCLVLLYNRGAAGATYQELQRWVRPTMQANLRRTLNGLEHDKAFVHADGDMYFITRTGQHYVEDRRLVEHR